MWMLETEAGRFCFDEKPVLERDGPNVSVKAGDRELQFGEPKLLDLRELVAADLEHLIRGVARY